MIQYFTHSHIAFLNNCDENYSFFSLGAVEIKQSFRLYMPVPMLGWGEGAERESKRCARARTHKHTHGQIVCVQRQENVIDNIELIIAYAVLNF